MDLPSKLTIHDAWFALDGGTTQLNATDERGTEHCVTLIQHAFLPGAFDPEQIPGRLYFNGDAVAIRSPRESAILGLLKAAEIRVTPGLTESPGQFVDKSRCVILGDDIKRVLSGTPEEGLRAMLEGVIAFVESERYVSFATEVERARDFA